MNAYTFNSITINTTEQAIMLIQARAANLKAKIRIGNFLDNGVYKWDAIVEFKDGSSQQVIATSLSLLVRTLAKELDKTEG